MTEFDKQTAIAEIDTLNCYNPNTVASLDIALNNTLP